MKMCFLSYNGLFMRWPVLLLLMAMSVEGQTNTDSTNTAGVTTNLPVTDTRVKAGQIQDLQMVEQIRTTAINGRRSICGRILKVLPEGLVVESGYTNLVRYPLDRSWLLTGTVVAARTPNLVESSEPGSMCVGLVFLRDYPKSRRTKPKPYDYVVIEGYPAGQYTYQSVGTVQRTVRQFSASISSAVKLNLPSEKK
jgi:hypothetical protein